jgi:hypothetical protein
MRNLSLMGDAVSGNPLGSNSVISAGIESNSTLKIPSIPQSTAGNAGFKLGVIEAKRGNVRKRIIDVAGKPQKDSKHSLSVSLGLFSNRAVNGLYGLADLLSEIDGTDQALTLGTTEADGFYGVVSADELTKPQYANYQQTSYRPGHILESNNRIQGYVSRTADFVKQPAGTYALVLDHDAEPGKAELSTEQFWNALCELVPSLRTVGRLVTPSSSAGIYDKVTGELLKPETSHHTYILCKGDMDRLVDVLKVNGWLKGLSFFKLGEPNKATGTSAVLERHVLDLAVFSFERLIYEAGATFEADSPFYQKRSLPVVHDGAVLDCDSLPVPTAEQRAQADKLKQAAREEIAPARFKKAVEHCQKTEGLDRATAEATATRRLSQCDRGVLAADHILYGMSGQTYLAGELTKADDGLLLRDPQEPDYRNGAQVARLFWGDKGNGWTIVSQAHGGTKYRLATEKTEAAAAKKATAKENALKWKLAPTQIEELPTRYVGTALVEKMKAGHDGIFVPSVCGSGKSTALGHLAKFCGENGYQFVLVTNREADAKGQARALTEFLPNILYRKDLSGLQPNEFPHIVACFASIRDDVNHLSWLENTSRRTVFVFDEADQLPKSIRDGKASDSLRKMKVLRALLKQVGVVVCMSAGLRDEEIRLYTALGELRNTVTIGVLKAPNPRKITLFTDEATDSPGSATMQHNLKKRLAAGDNVLLLTGSQCGDSAYGTMTFESLVTEHWDVVKPEQVLRVDSQSTHDQSHQAFDIGAKADKLDIFGRHQLGIGSPSMMDGISLDMDSYYQAVYVFDNGMNGIPNTIQMMSRDRESDCPIYVAVKPSQPHKDFSGMFEPSDIFDRLTLLSNNGKLPDLISRYTDRDQRPSWDDPFVRYFCESIAQQNCCDADRPLNFTRYARSIGHSVSKGNPLDHDKLTIFKKKIKNLKDCIAADYQEKISAAKALNGAEVKTLKDGNSRSLDDYFSLLKWDMLKDAKLIESREFDEDGKVVKKELPTAHESINVTPALVNQLRKQKVGTPWRRQHLADHGETVYEAVAAEKISKRRVSNRDRDSQIIIATDYTNMNHPKLALLDEYGFIDFYKRHIVNRVDLDAVIDEKYNLTLMRGLIIQWQKKNPDIKYFIANELTKLFPESRFTSQTPELLAIVEKLREGTTFETFCARLGVRSQRDKDGSIGHEQVLTILRNFFSFKSYRSSNRLNGVKGVFILCSDDKFNPMAKKANQLGKEPYKDREKTDPKSIEDELRALYDGIHRRTELFPAWDDSIQLTLSAAGITGEFTSKKAEVEPPPYPPYIKEILSKGDKGADKCQLDAVKAADGLQVSVAVADVIEEDKDTSPPATAPTATPTGDKEVSQLALVDRGNELAQAVTYQMSQRVPQPIMPADVTGLVQSNPSDIDIEVVHLEQALIFQQALIDAQSLADLERAKRNTPEDVRRDAMKLWVEEDRFNLLKAKVERLRAQEGALVAA